MNINSFIDKFVYTGFCVFVILFLISCIPIRKMPIRDRLRLNPLEYGTFLGLNNEQLKELLNINMTEEEFNSFAEEKEEWLEKQINQIEVNIETQNNKIAFFNNMISSLTRNLHRYVVYQYSIPNTEIAMKERIFYINKEINKIEKLKEMIKKDITNLNEELKALRWNLFVLTTSRTNNKG